MGESATDLSHQTQGLVFDFSSTDLTVLQRGPLDAPSTRHIGHKNKLIPGLVVAELEADAILEVRRLRRAADRGLHRDAVREGQPQGPALL